jgi:hypothetical protein
MLGESVLIIQKAEVIKVCFFAMRQLTLKTLFPLNDFSLLVAFANSTSLNLSHHYAAKTSQTTSLLKGENYNKSQSCA